MGQGEGGFKLLPIDVGEYNKGVEASFLLAQIISKGCSVLPVGDREKKKICASITGEHIYP